MSLAIHTDTPLLPLTRMVGDTANIEVETTTGNRKCCFYGWGEAMASPITCTPHHVVWGMDPEETEWAAKTLIRLGHQVVVTMPDNPEDQFGDHHVVTGMPTAYDADHSH